MRKAFTSFDEMQLLECDVCQNTRAARCRVRQSNKDDTRHAQPPFSEAPYVVPYNMPKYFAQQLRALQFAQSAQPPQQLLWIVARDMPFLGTIKELRGAELAKREAQWLQKHDMATNGIMGFFPATLNEPVRFTATQSKQLKIFKNTRGILVNWELHPVDLALLQGEQAQELILKQTPRKLYVQIPKATWKYSKSLPPGVFPLKPVFRPWHLDKAGNNRIRRFGFQLVPDFSGTAHSYVGYTLEAALADCLSWDNAPTRDHMLRSYCTMSRTCTAETLLVMQPFAPMLFRQGEFPGPHLMMEYWHGRLADDNLKAAWKSAEASQEKAKNRLEDVQWPCSMCKKELDSTHYGVSPKSDKRFLDNYWKRIMLPGEWRMCMNCKAEHRGGKFEKSDTYECRICHQDLPLERFHAERLQIWRQHSNYNLIICLQCTPVAERQWWDKKADQHRYSCSSCKKALPRTAYNSDGFADQNAIVCMECNRAAIVKRRNLEQKKFDCFGPCQRKQLGQKDFTGSMLLRTEMKKWLCKACQFPHCDVCGVVSDEAVPFGHKDHKEMKTCKNYERHWICEWCLYPPCGGCGLRRSKNTKNAKRMYHLWFCQTCWGAEVKETTQEHPPCSGCGLKKTTLEKRLRSKVGDLKSDFALEKDVHAQRPWRCSACWRKANAKSLAQKPQAATS